MQGLPVQTFQEKKTEKYLVKIPDDSHDLHIQLYFTEPFESMVTSKKIFKIIRELEARLGAADLEGDFEMELITEAQSIYLGSKGFWDSLVTDIDGVLRLVEGTLDDMC